MTFDDILASCIKALEQGATIEQCLRQYPEHAPALAPLLRLVVDLRAEAQIQLSPMAFARGRAALAARGRQRRDQPRSTVRHRQSILPVASHPQNGQPSQRRQVQQRSRRRLAAPRFLELIFLLLTVVSVTTFVRAATTSLPGSWLYPVRSAGEQVMGVLMEAAGEEFAWHTAQTEKRLRELATLSATESATAPILVQTIESHGNAALAATLRLPAAERTVRLHGYIARLEALQTAWAGLQADTPQVAVQTVRRLIEAGEQLIPAATPSIAATATLTPTLTLTITPSGTPTDALLATATPLLQATATDSTIAPILVPSPTPLPQPTATLTAPAPTATATPLPPTETATPLPEITVQIPQQTSSDQQADHNDNDEEERDNTVNPETVDTVQAGADAITPTASATEIDLLLTPPSTEEAPQAEEPTSTSAATPDPMLVTPVNTAAPTSEQPTPTDVSEPQQPATPTAEVATPASTRVTPQSPSATATPKLPAPPTATKTPKPTATKEGDGNARPTEKPPAPTTQPTANATTPGQEPSPAAPTATPAQTATPRPSLPGNEATRVSEP